MENSTAETANGGNAPGAPADDAPTSEAASHPHPGWVRSLLLVLALMAVYLVNRRMPISSYDTVANEWFPYVLTRGEGPFLDRYFPKPLPPWERLPDYANWA